MHALDAGFSQAITWYNQCATDTLNAEEWVELMYLAPANRKLFEFIEEEKTTEFKAKLLQRVKDIFALGRPISFESLILVAVA